MPTSRRLALPLLVVLVAGCASAGKRLEQGMEAEARGDYHQAVSRYLQALEKDPEMQEAREGLFSAWESALTMGLAFTEEASAAGDPLAAADEFRALDALIRKGREIRVTLPTPDDYAPRRRAALDAGADELMALGDELRADGRWRDARNAYRRILDEMDPLAAQRRASLDAQADALVAWAEEEHLAGRHRAAFLRAEEALAVAPELPRDVADAAASLRERALSSGLRVLAVFPVGSTSEVRRASLTDLEAQLSDVLETEHWRRPPLFVAVADPAAVRRVTRRVSPEGTTLQPRFILDEVGADFGALVELVELEAEERNVRNGTRTARTRDGRDVTYTVVDGRIQYTLVAEVTLFDERGIRMESFRVRNTEGDDFRRARYDGDFEELQLGRGERLLFNPGEERRHRAGVQASLLEEMAGDLARQVFDGVVRRIP